MSRFIHPRVEAMIHEIIKVEGGFVNHPADPGGPTKHGISLRYARSKGLEFDLDKDGDVDIDDIRILDVSHAFNAFLEDFYFRPGFDKLPADLQPQMTDFGINSGPGTAVTHLQRLLVRLGQPIKVDGDLGPKTLAALSNAIGTYGLQFINNTLVEDRCAYLRELVRRKPAKVVFLSGWTKRARSYRL